MSSENEDDYGQTLNPTVLKKRKIQRACDICRRKKIRCDGPQRPHNKCSNCFAYSAECTYEEAAKKRGRPKGYVEELELRVEKLEKLLKKLCPDDSVLRDLYASMDPGATAHLTKMPASADDPTPMSGPSSNAISTPSPEPRATSVLDLIRTLASKVLDDPFRDDDFDGALSGRMGLLSIDPGDSRFFGKSSGAMFVRTAMEVKSEYMKDDPIKRSRGVAEGKRPAFWTRQPWQKALLDAPKSEYNFPPSDLIMELTNAYFKHVNLFLPLLHRPTFERAVADELHLRDDGFASILLLVCAVASRYLDKIDERVLMDGVDSHHSAGWKWYVQVQIGKRKLLQPPTLYDLQSYCLAVEFLHGCFAPHSSWVLVGIGIRLAQDVGVHRRRVPRECMTVEDELWKRAFWVLITMDRMTSSGLGRVCAIVDEDFDLDMPMECDDEYWEHPDPKRRFKQPIGVPSVISAFNQQLRLNRIMGFALFSIYSIKTKFWEFVLQHWEQHIVTELDSALNQWIGSLPEYLRWDPNRSDDRFFKLSAGLMACYYHVQILIHRPFIRAKGSHSPLSFPSLAICTNAARSCSHVLELHMKRCGTVYPHMQVCAVTAGIVLLVNMWGSKRSGIGADPKEMKQIYKCMDVLKKAEERWHPAGQLLDILNELASAGERMLPEEDSALLANQELKKKRLFGQSPSKPANIEHGLRIPSSSGFNSGPFGVHESTNTLSSLSAHDTYLQPQIMHDMRRTPHSQADSPFTPSHIVQSHHPPFNSQSASLLSGSDGQPQEQISLTPSTHHIAATDNWYLSLPSGGNSSGDSSSATQDHGQLHNTPAVTDVYPDPEVPPLPDYPPEPFSSPASVLHDNTAAGYPFGVNMATGMGITSIQNQRYPTIPSTYTEQPSIVDSNTMAMWLNAPSGFQFTEWGNFVSNVAELTMELHDNQETGSRDQSGSFM